MKDEQALNEKLAKWAGFSIREQRTIDLSNFPDTATVTLWNRPDGECAADLPKFTLSLDNCFEWLVPKLQITYPEYQVSLKMLAAQYRCTIDYYAKPKYKRTFKWQRLIGTAGETHPIALCLAIEKLIDAEANTIQTERKP